MSATAPVQENPLASAAIQLRDICREHDHFTAPFDAASLERMLVHIDNINHSVVASTRDHVNASKRLRDFAATLERLARHFEAQDGNFALRVKNVARALDDAGEELASSDAIPAWRAPGVPN